mmetsp:Transcript_8168/g.11988  ORF Transcript_8168/g.11988 Transcript_8168/m.11988 type:complete len:83 (-) Transcript_8168:13-261(-)
MLLLPARLQQKKRKQSKQSGNPLPIAKAAAVAKAQPIKTGMIDEDVNYYFKKEDGKEVLTWDELEAGVPAHHQLLMKVFLYL